MKKFLSIFLSIFLIISLFNVNCFAQNNNEIKGNLVIVGGALRSSNSEVYNKFIQLAGGKENAKIGIIPAASSKPVFYANEFKKDLIMYGVPQDKIEIIPIAVKNDKTTPDVDESTWLKNGDNPEIARKIKEFTGIWFVGGDQTRITQTLIRQDGSNTLVLDALWEIYKNGAVLGGTSAGAAIMSNPMFAGGSSLEALKYGITDKYTTQEGGPACLVKGLGFFPHGLIDQHFNGKGRFGRLLVAAYEIGSSLSFGVDEDSALVYYGKEQLIEAIGLNGVTIFDLSRASKNKSQKLFNINNAIVHYIDKGDKFNPITREFIINPKKELTNGYEYYEIKNPISTGIFERDATTTLMTKYLVDNYNVNKAVGYAFDNDGIGFEFTFIKDNNTKGYWAYIDGNVDHYAAINVILNVKPIKVEIKEYNEKQPPKKAEEIKSEKYVILKPGDSLQVIAKQLKIKLEDILRLNKITNIKNINPWTLIKIPN